MAKKKYTAKQQQPKRPTKSVGAEAADWRPWVLLALAFLLYSTGLSNGLLGIDDHSATVDNPAVKNLDFTVFNLGMYAPFTWMAYAIAYHLGGDHSFLYHLLSAVVHAANVWLLYRLLQRLDISQSVAFAVALLFAIHPIQVESVAWIAGFSTPFFTLFCLLSMEYYLRHAATGQGSRQHYLWSLGLFAAACLAKSTAVMLPLLLLVLDFYWKKPNLERRKQILGYAPFFLIALGFGLLTFYTRAAAGVDVGASANDFSVLERALVVCYTPLLYWSKLLLPLHLSIYYSFNKVNGALPIIYYLAPLILGGVIWAAWRYRQQAPYIRQGLLFFGANILFTLPFYSVGTFELCADHYNYLAAAGFFFVLISLWEQAKKSFPKLSGSLHTLGVVWLIAMLLFSLMQIRLWKDTISIVDHAIKNGFHQGGKLYQARAIAYANDRKDLKSAMRDFDKALETNPDLYEVYKYRGGLLGITKQYDRSLADLNKYLEQFPDDPEILYNRALTLVNLQRLPDALKDLDRTLEINPDFDRAYRARGNVRLQLGDESGGAADFQEFERRTGINPAAPPPSQ